MNLQIRVNLGTKKNIRLNKHVRNFADIEWFKVNKALSEERCAVLYVNLLALLHRITSIMETSMMKKKI